MKLDRNQQSFFALLRAGLWEKDVRLVPYGEIDFSAILDLAEEQSVVGLLAAGIEHVADVKPAKMDVLQFVGRTVQIEQQNQMMNQFIAELVEKMRVAGIYTILVKGQGIAQCYERPLWRTCGDVDLFLDAENYQKAKAFLMPLAEHVDGEDTSRLHLGMTIDSWLVELHGTLHTNLSKKINTCLDELQWNIFHGDEVRSWDNNGVQIFLPSANNDAILIFTHILGHFYVGGIGLRQICDWCRLLWTYRSEIDVTILEKKLQNMGIMSEWRAFGSFAVEWLGMPVEAMPLHSNDEKWGHKARRIASIVMEVGNMGHNIDESYRRHSPKWKSLCITFCSRLRAFVRLTMIFPGNAPKFFVTYVGRRMEATCFAMPGYFH